MIFNTLKEIHDYCMYCKNCESNNTNMSIIFNNNEYITYHINENNLELFSEKQNLILKLNKDNISDKNFYFVNNCKICFSHKEMKNSYNCNIIKMFSEFYRIQKFDLIVKYYSNTFSIRNNIICDEDVFKLLDVDCPFKFFKKYLKLNSFI